MLSVGADWNPKQKELKALLSKKDRTGEAIALCLAMHGMLHDLPPTDETTHSGVMTADHTGAGFLMVDSYLKDLTDGLPDAACRFRPANSFATIAWNLWHITRIEDAIINIILADGKQVLTAAMQKMIGSPVRDTGNAMSAAEVDAFSAQVRPAALLDYRRAVGLRTREILGRLTAEDLGRKAGGAQLRRMTDEGVILNAPDSIWLIDFWANKTVAGLLQMPITRHQIVHLNDCFKIKARCIKENNKGGPRDRIGSRT